ncbi:hypothetical protein OOK36_43335 [Streptomyces sp. NBC_00365]|nr:hypothetical protein [Streptomyces sp. NBC_00365]MCX5095562.1 hypothetical protein [Streptomyces sp. NBC_00365]
MAMKQASWFHRPLQDLLKPRKKKWINREEIREIAGAVALGNSPVER